ERRSSVRRQLLRVCEPARARCRRAHGPRPVEPPAPWFDVWVPARAAETYAGEVLAGLTEADTGGDPILLYPTRTAPFTRPLLRLPAGELAWQFDILRTALPTSPAPELMVRDNRRLFEAVRDL